MIAMKRYIYNLFTVVGMVSAFWACTIDNGDFFEFVEFGVSQTELDIPAKALYEGGEITDSLSRTVNILSNTDCIISYLDSEVEWMRMKNLSSMQICRQIVFKGDISIKIDCDQNDDYARTVKLLVATCDGTRRDTLYVRQAGKRVPTITLDASTLVVNGSSSGEASMIFETNISDTENIAVSVAYPETETDSWVTRTSLSETELSLNYEPNPSGTDLRFATVRISYTDGSDTEHFTNLYLVQKTSEDGLGTILSFDDVRQMAQADMDVEITENILIEGYVVSDVNSGNVGDNEKTSSETADYTCCRKNFYLESLDGKYGFMVQTLTEEDNIFERYDKVTLLLRGAFLHKDSDPDRYTIKGLGVSALIDRQTGMSESIPVKEKYISELTDDDIFTYVTLKDCEFGVRKGSLTPVNEGYTIGKSKGNLTKYPRLVRDIQGNSLYLYTNTTCDYRRNGVRLPWGSGKLSGVIVHELYPAYVYGDGYSDDDSGNIGRYQIRHMSYEDIAFDMETSTVSTILTEYRYTSEFRLDGNIHYFLPTYGNNGRFYHSSGEKPLHPLSTFNYIGWTGTSNGTEPFRSNIGCDMSIEEPLGYKVADGVVYDYSTTNTDGAGKTGIPSNSEVYDGWRCLKWWHPTTDEKYSWIIEFSTAGIQTEHISMQFTSYGAVTGSVGKSPYYWKAQWSLTGDNTNDEQWNDIADYVVPDGLVGGTYKEWQLPALKQYDIQLPKEILGHDKVYIRLTPASKVTNTIYFAEGTVMDGSDSGNAMDYFAIRYK